MGEYFHLLANGIDESPVEENSEIKSLSKEYTFEHDTDNKEELLKTIDKLAKDLQTELKIHNIVFKTVTLKLRYSNFETHTRSKSTSLYSGDELVIKSITNSMLEEFLKSKRKIRLVGVRVSNLKFGTKQKKLTDQ